MCNRGDGLFYGRKIKSIVHVQVFQYLSNAPFSFFRRVAKLNGICLTQMFRCSNNLFYIAFQLSNEVFAFEFCHVNVVCSDMTSNYRPAKEVRSTEGGVRFLKHFAL